MGDHLITVINPRPLKNLEMNVIYIIKTRFLCVCFSRLAQMTTRSKSTPDKPKATPITVKIPISKGYSVSKLAHWLSTLEGATEDILDTFTVSDLKLIILCARDRELFRF